MNNSLARQYFAQTLQCNAHLQVFDEVTPGHTSEWHLNKPSMRKLDSTRKTRQTCWEFELFAAATMFHLYPETLEAAKLCV